MGLAAPAALAARACGSAATAASPPAAARRRAVRCAPWANRRLTRRPARIADTPRCPAMNITTGKPLRLKKLFSSCAIRVQASVTADQADGDLCRTGFGSWCSLSRNLAVASISKPKGSPAPAQSWHATADRCGRRDAAARGCRPPSTAERKRAQLFHVSIFGPRHDARQHRRPSRQPVGRRLLCRDP